MVNKIYLYYNIWFEIFRLSKSNKNQSNLHFILFCIIEGPRVRNICEKKTFDKPFRRVWFMKKVCFLFNFKWNICMYIFVRKCLNSYLLERYTIIFFQTIKKCNLKKYTYFVESKEEFGKLSDVKKFNNLYHWRPNNFNDLLWFE